MGDRGVLRHTGSGHSKINKEPEGFKALHKFCYNYDSRHLNLKVYCNQGTRITKFIISIIQDTYIVTKNLKVCFKESRHLNYKEPDPSRHLVIIQGTLNSRDLNCKEPVPEGLAVRHLPELVIQGT